MSCYMFVLLDLYRWGFPSDMFSDLSWLLFCLRACRLEHRGKKLLLFLRVWLNINMMGWICGNRSIGTLSLLASLTREVIKAREQNGKEEDTWAVEALDILLDTWTVLLQVSILQTVMTWIILIFKCQKSMPLIVGSLLLLDCLWHLSKYLWIFTEV